MAVPVRQTLEGMGFNVGWDPATKNISLTSPYGQTTSLASDQYSMQGDRAYMDPSQMQSLFMHPDYYKPPTLTQESVTKNLGLAQQLYSPVQDLYSQAYDKQLAALSNISKGQQGLVEAGYQQAQSNLGRQEQQARRTTSHNVAGRNISNSPLAAYEKRKIQEAYAPEYQQLESNRGAQLANIANNAIAASENLAAQGLQQQAAFAQRLGEAAYNMAMQQAAAPATWANNALSALGNMVSQQNSQANQQLQRDQLNFQKQQWETEWPYQQKTYEYNLNKPYYSPNTGGGGGLTPYQMYQMIRDEKTDRASLYSDARKLADTSVEKGNYQAGTWSPKDLVRAYEEMGYDPVSAAKAAQNDPRNIYNYFIDQLGQERGMNTGPSDDDIKQYLK